MHVHDPAILYAHSFSGPPEVGGLVGVWGVGVGVDVGGSIMPTASPNYNLFNWIPGYSDRGAVCGVCPSQYDPGMARVSLGPGIL